MALWVPVMLAEGLVIKGMACLALGLVAYLYWTSFREKRQQRRHRKWQAEKRREYETKLMQNQHLPPGG